MDNTGPYVTYIELFERLFPSSIVSYKSDINLDNKTGNVFDYSGTSFTLEVGDIVCQGQYGSPITNIATGKITLDNATNFTEDAARVYRTTLVLFEVDMMILSAMQTIDLFTKQWFNKRTFTGDSAIQIEGNNSHILHFQVPIIGITGMYLNNSQDIYPADAYQAFKSRSIPDDRRNPKIMLMSKTESIYATPRGRYWNSIFLKGKFTKIEGSFGFLEMDGSTPAPIKWVAARIVMKQITYNPENVMSAKVVREKTDMHEIQFETTQESGDVTKWDMTGDTEVDRILTMYKAPSAIGGPDPMYSQLIQLYDYRTTI
jgi:hypothetical protein